MLDLCVVTGILQVHLSLIGLAPLTLCYPSSCCCFDFDYSVELSLPQHNSLQKRSLACLEETTRLAVTR